MNYYTFYQLNETMKDYVFKLEMKSRDYECDIQGVVNHANYLHYLEVTRLEFLESIGGNFAEWHDKGIDLMVTNINITYKTSLHGGEKFLSCLNLKREGARYIYYQDIYRMSDMKLCIKAEVQSVVVVNGSLSRGDELDGYLSQYYV